MKSSIVTTKKTFQPITINITIENKLELDLLFNLMKRSVGIPFMLQKDGTIEIENANKLTDIMDNIYATLAEAKKSTT